MSPNEQMSTMLMDVATRIRELREIAGFSEEMAKTIGRIHMKSMNRSLDLPFTFIHYFRRGALLEVRALNPIQ